MRVAIKRGVTVPIYEILVQKKMCYLKPNSSWVITVLRSAKHSVIWK